MSFNESLKAISPPWLLGRVGERLGFVFGIALDAFQVATEEGVKARFPLVAPPDALPFIGRDRKIDRGPTESNASYADRLSKSFEAWRNAGGPYTLLDQLQSFFLPRRPVISVVNVHSTWHTIDGAGVITRRRTSPANWNWDGVSVGSYAHRWARCWIVIDATGIWTPSQHYGDGSHYGDGHTYGSNATISEVLALRRIAKRWKPAHAKVVNMIAKFDPTLFLPTNAPGYPMPDGDWNDYANRAPNAAYWKGV